MFDEFLMPLMAFTMSGLLIAAVVFFVLEKKNVSQSEDLKSSIKKSNLEIKIPVEEVKSSIDEKVIPEIKYIREAIDSPGYAYTESNLVEVLDSFGISSVEFDDGRMDCIITTDDDEKYHMVVWIDERLSIFLFAFVVCDVAVLDVSAYKHLLLAYDGIAKTSLCISKYSDVDILMIQYGVFSGSNKFSKDDIRSAIDCLITVYDEIYADLVKNELFITENSFDKDIA